MLFRIRPSIALAFFCFCALVVSSQFLPSRLAYVFLALIVGVSLLSLCFNGSSFIKSDEEKLVLVLGFLIILSWVYGLFVGALSGVPNNFLFVNFAGMVFYFLVFSFFFVRPAFSLIIKVFLLAFVVQLVYGGVAVWGRSESGVMSGLSGAESFSELRSVYSVGFAVGFPVFSVSLYSLLNSVKVPEMFIVGGKSALMYVVLSAFLLVVPAMSKGFVLAVFILGASVFFSAFVTALRKMKASRGLFFAASGLLVFGSISLYYLHDVIAYSFSGEEVSNAKRFVQAGYLLDEVTFFGAGLGAGLESGYTRAPEPYAFELSYLSVLHKLGLFSLPLFLAYLYCFVKSFRGLFSEEHGVMSAFSLGLMGCAIVGIGNPILLGSLAVLFHSLSMYFLASQGQDRVVKY